MATKWTDAEKNALLVSIIAASGAPKWDEVAIPPGRTKKACMHVYTQAKQQAADLNKTDTGSGSAPAAPKTPKKIKATTNGMTKANDPPQVKATPKRKRTAKVNGTAASGPEEGEEDQGEDSLPKKHKTESADEALGKIENVKEEAGGNAEEDGEP